MKLTVGCLLIIGFLHATAAVLAQTCPVVEQIVAENTCAGLERGQLCLDGGIVSLQGQPNFDVKDVSFAKIQANYPDVAADQFVSVVFVGQLQIVNEADVSPDTLPVRVPIFTSVSGQKANIRALPSRSAKVVSSVGDKAELVAFGQSSDGLWLRVQIPDDSTQAGWISSQLVKSDYDLGALETAKGDDPVPQYPTFTPMQTFSLQSDDPCAGVMIQPTETTATVQVNGVILNLNSATVFAQPAKDMLRVFVLTGTTSVETDQGVTTVPAGAFTEVALNSQNVAADTPLPANGYEAETVTRFSGNYLPQPVTPVPPASPDQIKAALLTPLSGSWNVPYYAGVMTGADCPPGSSGGYYEGGIDKITVTEDGQSMSIVSPYGEQTTAVQTAPGVYNSGPFPFTVVSPTEIHVGPFTMGTWVGLACKSTAQFTMTYIGG